MTNSKDALQENSHIPVLLKEVISNIYNSKLEKQNYFDGTFGGGGYSQELLQQSEVDFKTKTNLLELNVCDLDNQTFQNVKAISEKYPDFNINFMNANFADYIQQFEDNYFGGIMLDLGFSSNQLEYSERGFSYLKREDILDLRYNLNQGQNLLSKLKKMINGGEIGRIIFKYSGEKLSMRIGGFIFEYLEESKAKELLVGDFVDLIVRAIPRQFQKNKFSILSRVWQALRIWVNDEFESLERFLNFAPAKLISGGHLAVVSFHSLEDKLVTKKFRELAALVVIDAFGNTKQDFRVLTKKAIIPTEGEISQNSRSRSALLRVLEKV